MIQVGKNNEKLILTQRPYTNSCVKKKSSWQRFFHNRESHNVNCRFCGAIHNVDWACINVLSQVIHNVNERKTVQTNMISFVSHGAGILTIMEASAEHDCCSEAQRNARRTRTSYFVCTVFLFHYIKWLPCERTLISALLNL